MESNVALMVVTDSFHKVFDRLLQFFPDMMTSVLVFTVGLVLGFIVKFVFLKLFTSVGLDKISEKAGTGEILRKGGLKENLSVMLSKALGLVTVLSFFILSLQSLHIPAVDHVLEKFIFYLPNIFVSAGIIFAGYLLSIFLGRAALIASVNAGFRLSGLMANSVRVAIFVLAVTMAFEQLSIGGRAIVIAFAIIFGGVVLALALAFGLGGRDFAREYLEKRFRGEERDEIAHL
jgi:hypothetical protein